MRPKTPVMPPARVFIAAIAAMEIRTMISTYSTKPWPSSSIADDETQAIHRELHVLKKHFRVPPCRMTNDCRTIDFLVSRPAPVRLSRTVPTGFV